MRAGCDPRAGATPEAERMHVVAVESVTLDGVMQAPGRPDEDTRGGFARGGWAVPYSDEVMGRAMGERMARGGALLLGRRTYEDLYGYWPKQPPNPFTDVLTRTTKHVASTTLRAPLPWENSVLLDGDAVAAVRRMRTRGGGDLAIIGSGALVRALARAGLVDEFLLLVHPLVLGTGQRLFDGVDATLRLADSLTTTTGVIIATYTTSEEAR
jgi:dihydrofolate reductase